MCYLTWKSGGLFLIVCPGRPGHTMTVENKQNSGVCRQVYVKQIQLKALLLSWAVKNVM